MTNILKQKYRGVTVLLLTVTLLLISMLLILFAAQYSALQQKISSNLYRNQQAFEAAQAGLEAALPYFQANASAIEAQASGGFLTPYLNSSTQNVALANGSQYTFVYTNPTANNYQLLTITSTGVNADGTSTRVLSQQIQTYGSSMTTPTVTVSTQGNVHLSNSASINNTQTNANIVAGSNVQFSNSADTTTSAGVTSNSSKTGNDIQQNQSGIASLSSDAYFKSIFGVSSATLQSKANYTYTNNRNTSYNTLNGVTGAIIWINQTGGTASISNSAAIGSAAKPVILVVNGNLALDNSVTIYGFIFILNPSSDTELDNSATINGAISSTNDINLFNTSTLNYNASVLAALPSIAGSNNYAKVPASWRDF